MTVHRGLDHKGVMQDCVQDVHFCAFPFDVAALPQPLHGDCVEVMRGMEPESIDAIVTDPPYGLEFMGKEWDRLWSEHPQGQQGRIDGVGGMDTWNRAPQYQAGSGAQRWHEQWATEALRVLKPGGHLLAFGGPRTFHRLTCGIEDAGFEIRDTIAWMFGSGFPKSARVNRDPRFCQCGEPERNGAYIAPSQSPEVRTDTVPDAGDDGPLFASAHHSKRTREGSQGDCPPDRDSDDGHARPVPATGRSSPQRQRGALAHSRSVAPEGASASESAHSPSPAQRNVRRASPGSPILDKPLIASESDTHESIEPSPQTDSDNGSRVPRSESMGEFPSALPHCTRCGKPDANGLGTALKPGWEPCVVARKPLKGTVAANVERYGTGALNIDACRIGTEEIAAHGGGVNGDRVYAMGKGVPAIAAGSNPHVGRWPANVALDEDAAAMLDEQSGITSDVPRIVRRSGRRASSGWGFDIDSAGQVHGDTGGASRFFYTAKASRSEREAWGRMTLPAERRTDGRAKDIDNPRLRTSERVNDHPTVKPLALMEWLIKLVTPEGGVVLDPFCGSGSTLVAARRLNVRAIGIEQDERSVEIARQRIAAQWEVNLL